MRILQTWKGNYYVCSSSILDGRDTKAELIDIQTATPNDMWALRAQLLGDSPHLSMEVLIETSDRTDVFPDDVLFDILSANPDELKKDTLIRYLENKEDPLPAYMIAILQQVAGGITYKTVLQEQMAKYNRLKTIAAYDIIRSNLNDSVVNMTELRNWLDNIGNIRADKQIIATYLQEDDFTAALNLLNALPATYSLSGNQMLAYNDYSTMVQLNINLAQQGRNIFQLDSIEFANTVDIADNGLGSAVYEARNILEFAYGYHYYACPSLPDSIALKNQQGFNSKKLDFIKIIVKPNPANTWVAFDFQLPFNVTEGVIKITDIAGKLMETIPVTSPIGQKAWDVRHIQSGVYLYILEAGGYTKTGKLIIH